MATVTMTMEEYLQLINGLTSDAIVGEPNSTMVATPAAAKRKKTTAYQRKYKKAFKKIASQYKLKSGKWKKGGFKAAVKMAHKMAKK